METRRHSRRVGSGTCLCNYQAFEGCPMAPTVLNSSCTPAAKHGQWLCSMTTSYFMYFSWRNLWPLGGAVKRSAVSSSKCTTIHPRSARKSMDPSWCRRSWKPKRKPRVLKNCPVSTLVSTLARRQKTSSHTTSGWRIGDYWLKPSAILQIMALSISIPENQTKLRPSPGLLLRSGLLELEHGQDMKLYKAIRWNISWRRMGFHEAKATVSIT